MLLEAHIHHTGSYKNEPLAKRLMGRYFLSQNSRVWG